MGSGILRVCIVGFNAVIIVKPQSMYKGCGSRCVSVGEA